MALTPELASSFARTALANVAQEYPAKLDHVMGGPADVRGPRELHPAFYGSFDWHSSVHMHWSAVRLLTLAPDGLQDSTRTSLVDLLDQRLSVPALQIGESNEVLIGDKVIVGGGGRVSRSVAARLVGREEFAGYWEYVLDEALFTAPAHPMWSGAALIGPTGKLVGIGSLQMQQQLPGGKVTPLNMMVPIDLLPPVLAGLTAGGHDLPRRPWLGVLTEEISGRVVIVGATKNGPADRADLGEGDIVLAVGGEEVATLAEFYRAVWALGPPGVTVPLTLAREGDVFEVEVKSKDRMSFLKKPRMH